MDVIVSLWNIVSFPPAYLVKRSQVVYTVGFIPRPSSLIGDFVSCLLTDKTEEASHYVT